MRLFCADHIENTVSTILLSRSYRPSLRNGSSSIVACIRCRENVYGHSSVVIETAHMSHIMYLGRKVAGSIPDEVIGFFHLPNPSSRTMAMGSTQPLIEMSTRNLAEA
jgi:hypothetical protein